MRTFAFIIATALLAACGSEETTTTEAPVTEAPATDAAHGTEAAPAADGAQGGEAAQAGTADVTAAKLTAANQAVHPMQPWAEAETKLTTELGAPKVEENKYMWYVQEGENCQILVVEKMGDAVGSSAISTGPCPS